MNRKMHFFLEFHIENVTKTLFRFSDKLILKGRKTSKPEYVKIFFRWKYAQAQVCRRAIFKMKTYGGFYIWHIHLYHIQYIFLSILKCILERMYVMCLSTLHHVEIRTLLWTSYYIIFHLPGWKYRKNAPVNCQYASRKTSRFLCIVLGKQR